MSSHRTFLFLSLPPEQSIDGLEFHQLIYKRLLAYRIFTDLNEFHGFICKKAGMQKAGKKDKRLKGKKDKRN